MTCGIYCLQFEGTDKVYIGQSVNIELRLKRHQYTLKNNKASKKLMEAYITYGKPVGYIIESCAKENLSTLESLYIEEFDSFNNGFNTVEYHKEEYSTTALRGEDSPRSLYTNEQICQVFEMLISEEYYPPKIINKTTGVSLEVINGVSIGRRHPWLKDMYPDDYEKLFKRTYLEKQVGSQGAKARGIVYPPIYSPEGEKHNVDCVSQFARDHNLHSTGLGMVLNGKRLTHKGWHL